MCKYIYVHYIIANNDTFAWTHTNSAYGRSNMKYMDCCKKLWYFPISHISKNHFGKRH